MSFSDLPNRNVSKPLPWFRDATPGGKALLLVSAVLAAALPLAGAALDIPFGLVIALMLGELVFIHAYVAQYMQEETPEAFDDPAEEFDDLDEL